MIELSRGVARAFRAVLRKSVPASAPRGPEPPVFARSGPSGLELLCAQNGVLLRHAEPGKTPAACIAFPASLLAQFEGRDGGRVRLEVLSPGKGRASWGEGASGRVLEFPSPDLRPPEVPTPKMADPGAGFRAALAEAVQAVGGDASRQALRCVMLRGGEVVSTDGRQLLLQRGFTFPWEGEALVPALPAFASKDLAGHKALLGRAGDKVVMTFGPWTFSLDAQDPRHYPDVSRLLAGEWPSRIALDNADAAALLRALPSLPGKDDGRSPVTLVFGPRPLVRAGTEEVALPGSRGSGPPLTAVTDRAYLIRALGMGFREVAAGDSKPLMCRDADRTYLWMPLDDGPEKERQPAAVRPMRRAGRVPMNGVAAGPHPGPAPAPPEPAPPADALEEAEALRALSEEALARTARLVAALKRQRREDRAVKDAAATLRRLGGLGG